MIFTRIKLAALRAAWPLFLVAVIAGGGLFLWQSRAAALEALAASQERLAVIERVIEVERQRHLDAVQIVEDRRDRDQVVAAVQDACIDQALPSGLWE